MNDHTLYIVVMLAINIFLVYLWSKVVGKLSENQNALIIFVFVTVLYVVDNVWFDGVFTDNSNTDYGLVY